MLREQTLQLESLAKWNSLGEWITYQVLGYRSNEYGIHTGQCFSASLTFWQLAREIRFNRAILSTLDALAHS